MNRTMIEALLVAGLERLGLAPGIAQLLVQGAMQLEINVEPEAIALIEKEFSNILAWLKSRPGAAATLPAPDMPNPQVLRQAPEVP